MNHHSYAARLAATDMADYVPRRTSDDRFSRRDPRDALRADPDRRGAHRHLHRHFMGRVTRTASWSQCVMLGSIPEAHAVLRRVRAIHRRIHGIGADGTPFDAPDPRQHAWVSMTFTESMRDGTYSLPPIEDGSLPTTVEELRDRMATFTPPLATTALSRDLITRILRLEMFPRPQRKLLRPIVLAILSTIPDDLHDLLAPGQCRRAERCAALLLQMPIGLTKAIQWSGQPVEVATDGTRRTPLMRGDVGAGATPVG